MKRRVASVSSALPPYIGGKRRLCPLIFREIHALIPRERWSGLTFLDGFLGGGAVSLFAKAQGLRVISCDIAERSVVVGEALIANSRVRLVREDVLGLIAPSDAPAGRIETELVPSVFTRNVARVLDRSLEAAAASECRSKAALLKLLAMRLAMLAHPMAQVRPGTIHRLDTGEFESITPSCLPNYVGGLRITRPDRLWHLAQQINAGVFAGEGLVHHGSVLDLLPSLIADIAYFDPPYPGTTSYESEYKVIDQILEGEAKPRSPFSAKSGATLLDQLFERARHIPLWVLSLGNATVTVEDLQAAMRRHGRDVHAIELAYAHKASVARADTKERNREFLVLGRDPASTLMQPAPRPAAVPSLTTQQTSGASR